MKPDSELKVELIEYIKKNEPSFADTNLDDFSVTQLIIIKAGIDANRNYKKKGKGKN